MKITLGFALLILIALFGASLLVGSSNPIRSESVAPARPSYYPLDTGLTKLARSGDFAGVVKKLEDTLKK